MKIITCTLNHVCIIPPSLHRNKSTAVPVDVKKERKGAEVRLHSFLTSVLDRSEWSTSRSGRFTSGKQLSVVLVGFQSNQDNRQSSKKNNKYQMLYTYGLPPDDGPRYVRNMYRLTKYTKNKLCIKLVFLYTIISRCAVNKT